MTSSVKTKPTQTSQRAPQDQQARNSTGKDNPAPARSSEPMATAPANARPANDKGAPATASPTRTESRPDNRRPASAPSTGGQNRPRPADRPGQGTPGKGDQRSRPASGPNRSRGGSHRPGDGNRGARPPAGAPARPPVPQPATPVKLAKPTEIEIPPAITVRDLAGMLQESPIDLIKVLMNYGIMAPITQSIDFDTAVILGSEFGVDVKPIPVAVPEEEAPAMTDTSPKTLRQRIMESQSTEGLVVRPPVVAVLGHVDHGKTTLLDAIRKTNVVEGEAGGITQRMGAYQVELGGRKITFLDTPGHEAFTAMRARGAQVTDIVVLVVAADDGVMPQTKEAISHAKAAQVPIIVALNKVDKPNANPDRVKQELADVDLLIEEWGGDVICVPVSAKLKRGIEDLLENILLVAEINPLLVNAEGLALGTVIESEQDPRRGVIATMLVQSGTLKVSDIIVIGGISGRVRAMFDDKGNQVSEAPPSTPVRVMGLPQVPTSGDTFRAMADTSSARSEVAAWQTAHATVPSDMPVKLISLEDVFQKMQAGQVKELNLILKADFQGSLEPIVNSLSRLSSEEVKIRILLQGTGNISESDITLASASRAIVIGFNVQSDSAAQKLADNQGVDVRTYDVIYNLIEDVELALNGMLEPVYREAAQGQVEVRQVFKLSKYGRVAGCMVLSGLVARGSLIRVKRGSEVVTTTRMASLKRFQEDVPEVKAGFECGIQLEKFDDYAVGDILEAYKMERVR